MLLRLTFMAAWLAFVAACSEQIGEPLRQAEDPPAQAEEPGEPEVAPVFVQAERASTPEGEAQIDWDAARTDLASTPGNAMPESFQIQSGDQAPPVPVLLPSGIVQPAGAQFQPRFRQLPDGYYARYPGASYDITVSGTNEVFGGVSSAGETARFQATATGAIVSLTRYGAGYMVEFECKGTGEDGGACISEDEALEVASALVIAGSR
ncbi:MAG: hypothetical protein MRY64_04685 [Hyphomonadaceae bacterium]|nr:hypothetical protein [Hyphomonadaceae bacterium]